jgi:hypothetical protein
MAQAVTCAAQAANVTATCTAAGIVKVLAQVYALKKTPPCAATLSASYHVLRLLALLACLLACMLAVGELDWWRHT